MNEELKTQLKGYGLTDEQITEVEKKLGVTSVEDMKYVTEKDLTDLGVLPVPARKIVAAYKPKEPVAASPVAPTAPAVPGAPINITVATGNPDDMTVQQLVEAVSKGERSRDFTAALRRKTGGTKMHVFVRIPGSDQLDITSTMDLIAQDYQPGEEPKFWSSVPTETLTEVLMIRRFADPLTGEVLEKGDPWEKLGEETMAMAAYARMKGVVDKVDKYTITSEATQEPAHPRWTRIRALWTRGVRSNDPLVLEARAAIIYTKTSRHDDEEVRPSKGGEGFRERDQPF